LLIANGINETRNMNMEISLPVTAIFTFIFALFIFSLVYRVVTMRRKYKVGYGASKQDELKMAISAHSNAVENIPLGLFLLMLLEIHLANQVLLIILASVFLLARVIHAKGLNQSIGKSFGRTYGTIISWFVVIVMAALNVYYSIF